MTKVGAYAILRIHTMSFGPGIPATEGDRRCSSRRPRHLRGRCLRCAWRAAALPDGRLRLRGVHGHAPRRRRAVHPAGDDRGALLHRSIRPSRRRRCSSSPTSWSRAAATTCSSRSPPPSRTASSPRCSSPPPSPWRGCRRCRASSASFSSSTRSAPPVQSGGLDGDPRGLAS